MTKERIIKELKKFPDRDVHRTAYKLGIPSIEVSKAQHEYLKRFRKEK